MGKFVWLRDSAFPRVGPRLEKGKEHDAGEYPPAVVGEWIRSGAARIVAEEAPAPKPERKERAAKHSGERQT
jgi:hypothetical protein